jgi:MFS family permease
MDTTTSTRRGWLARRTFVALSSYNYRVWFVGQLLSLIGSWMQSAAQGYLLFELTHSAAYLGYVGFVYGLPTWLFTLIGGLVADRMPRRNLLVLIQVSMMLPAFLLAGLTFSGLVQPWHILVLAAFNGIANAFDAPARQSFVIELVDDREHLTNAIALNSSMFNLGLVIGPALGGLVYALAGPGWCFSINGISFLAVIAALLAMRMKPFTAPPHKNNAWQDILDGLRYVAGNDLVRLLIISLAVAALFGFSLVTLVPAWAVNVLGGDERTNGLLLSARGVGALIAALTLASLGERGRRGKIWTLGSFALPLGMFAFALTKWQPLSLALMALIGWGLLSMAINLNALIQSRVPDELRGRVMGIYSLTFMGFLPIGSLLVGEIASRWGEQNAVLFNAAVLLAFALLVYWRRPVIRAIH